MRRTIYITRAPTKASFYRSDGSTRRNAPIYFCASIQYQAQGRIFVATSSGYGDTTCLLSPDKHRLFGNTPLHGDLISNNSLLATVDIMCERNRPPVEVKTATSTIFVENASLPGTYAHIKTEELGYLAELSDSKPELSLRELWDSRLGFWRFTWGALLPGADRLAPELVPAFHATLAAYEFIVE